jgi:uncharacterized protein YutE (UPF0331/DUF86 family)
LILPESSPHGAAIGSRITPEAVRSLARDSRFPADVVAALEPLPGFRDVLIHEYVSLDLDRAVAALNRLEPLEALFEIARRIEGG